MATKNRITVGQGKCLMMFLFGTGIEPRAFTLNYIPSTFYFYYLFVCLFIFEMVLLSH